MSAQACLQKIFTMGRTGYLGRHLIPKLVSGAGHHVKGLVRGSSVNRLTEGCEASIGDASWPTDTFVHLVGVSRQHPLKADQSRKIDSASVQGAAEATIKAGIQHYV